MFLGRFDEEVICQKSILPQMGSRDELGGSQASKGLSGTRIFCCRGKNIPVFR
jgi:hypothetical protein